MEKYQEEIEKIIEKWILERRNLGRYGVTEGLITEYLDFNKPKIQGYRHVNVTVETAHDIYRELFLRKPNIVALPHEIQPLMLDMAIEFGPTKAIYLLQDVMYLCGLNFGPIDSVIGVKTALAAKQLYSEIGNDLINKLVQRRKAYYRKIADNFPGQAEQMHLKIALADGFLR